MAPAADSGVLWSDSTPVSSTPGASVPVTDRSSDWRSVASCVEPNSTASVLLPVSASVAPGGAPDGSRAVDARAVAGGTIRLSGSGAAPASEPGGR